MKSEAAAIDEAQARLGDDFVKAVRAILGCKGRVCVTGMGKAGLIGSKIQATFASTGTLNVITPLVAATNGSGVATATIASTFAETKVVSAVGDPGSVALTQTGTISFVPGPPSASVSTVTANPLTRIANGTEESTLTVTLLDAFSNPISGGTINFTSTPEQIT